ncbi:hypothetical protein NRH57_003257 [Providencia rettgeri]|uniref:Uncharacterized protein n=1 Tax=Providencia huaxiensis TaxID=2027290 RepID=A0A8I2DD73_9GAMM|nr:MULTISPECIES: hypothetical protein [Providencia]ELR5241362.1 hypothetical protein [Providencia rettgeri]MBQ0270518.1 hypothetical protein [Providencia huaxiensis]MCD2530347.1 hypothetical protein [Providencia huaxiensis]MCG5282174.1 hypothetical protein [Providencia rettgeri]
MNKLLLVVIFIFSTIAHSESYSDSKRVSLIDGHTNFYGSIAVGTCSLIFDNNQNVVLGKVDSTSQLSFIDKSIPVFFRFSSCPNYIYNTLNLQLSDGNKNKEKLFFRHGSVNFIDGLGEKLNLISLVDKNKLLTNHDIFTINISDSITGYNSFLNDLNNTAIFILIYP